MTFPDFITPDADGWIRLTDHRIGIESLAFHYNEGYTPEMLLAEFPTLSLPLIHKAIAFYLENQSEIDAYISKSRAECDRHRGVFPPGPSLTELRKRMASMQPLPAR